MPAESAETVVETKPQSSEQDAALDKSLDALLSDTDIAPTGTDSQEESSNQQRDDRGRFISQQSQGEGESADTPKDSSVVDSTEDADTGLKAPEGIDTEEFQKALKAAEYTGLPPSRIAQWLKDDPHDFIAYGLKRAKHIADTNRTIEELKKTGKTDKDEPDGQAAPSLDVDSIADPLIKHLADQFGDDVSKEPVRKLVKGLTDQFQRQLKEHLSERDQKTNVALEGVRSLLAEQARSVLLNEYPQLKNAETFQRVQKRMGQLASQQEYPSVQSLMEDATVIELLPELKAAKANSNKQKDRSVPIGATRGAKPPTAMTAAEARDASLEALMKGDIKGSEKLAAQARQLTQP